MIQEEDKMVINNTNTDTYTPSRSRGQKYVNLFWFRCHANTFRVPIVGYQTITEIANSKLRASTYKLYRWLCFQADRTFCGSFSAQLKKIKKEAGLSKPAIIGARDELVRLGLIRVERERGPGGRYYFTLMNPETVLFPLDWRSRPYPLYLCAPVASVLPDIYAKRWTGTDALVYDALCMEMGRSGQSDLPKKRAHWLSFVARNTLLAAEQHLVDTGFIRSKASSIEMLHPETSKSMPPRVWEQEPSERSYFYDADTGARRVFSEELLTPDVIEQYFIKSLPRATEWVPRNDAHCPFHSDENPSLSINVETGQFCCHACGIEGNKLVTFEMRLLDLEDVHKAWTSVAKKIGFKSCPRSRGKVTHRHEYRDESGLPQYVVLRYEDGTASFRHYSGCFLKPGLGRNKRMLYNLPEVIAADVVLITEGEKKSDLIAELRLLDENGKSVAVTCTGGADSWRTEFVEYLKGKRVLLLPDTDDPGIRYSDAVEASLTRTGVEFETIYFNDYGNDFRDFLKDHGSDELVTFIGSPWLRSPTLSCSLSEVEEEICI
jgi:hypothetical protein